MSSRTANSTTSAAGNTSIAALHPDIVLSNIINRLDAAALASTRCVSTQFQSLCNEDTLWRDICSSAWPSTAHPRVRGAISGDHRSFYYDAFPSVGNNKIRSSDRTPELISAVDIHFDDKPVYSKVVETETISSWFVNSPFRLELLDSTELVPTPLKFDGQDCAAVGEHLRISWILIDPAVKRAVNVASRKAVEARRHWMDDDIQLRYATVFTNGDGELAQCVVVVTCGGKDGGEVCVKDVSMQVEDMDGKIVNGKESLEILLGAMEGERRKIGDEMEKDIYERYLTKKEQFRERNRKREISLDRMFIATGVALFSALCIFFTVQLKTMVLSWSRMSQTIHDFEGICRVPPPHILHDGIMSFYTYGVTYKLYMHC